MKTNPTQAKLKLLLLCVLCVSALNVFAASINITEDTAESNKSYDDSDTTTRAALNLTSGFSYSGTNITLSATNNNPLSPSDALAKGAHVSYGILSLTNGSITTTGSRGLGISILGLSSSGTVNNVNIETRGIYAYGVDTRYSGALNLTGGTITTSNSNAYGMYFESSSGTVSNVNIETKEVSSHGVYANSVSALTLSGGSITTGSSLAYGIYLSARSTGTVSNVNVETKGAGSHGVYATGSSALTLTDSDISATGSDAYALYLNTRSTGTASLNHNTITGNILATGTSTLNLTGSNGTVLTGNVTGTTGATIGITLSGEGSKLTGNVTQDANSAVTLDISDGATLGDAATANTINGTVNIHDGGHISTTLTLTNGITLEAGAIIDYAGNAGGLIALGSESIIHIAESGVIVDFSGVTLVAGETYTIANFGDDYGSALYGEIFTATGLADGMTGEFVESYTKGRLDFTATAVPEPATWFLLGTGLGVLLLTARRRRNVRS